jgi:hypothetical protein
MELQAHAFAAGAMPAPSRERGPFAARNLVLRPLKQSYEIASVLHLRDEIDLSVHAAAGSHFTTLEKKETSAVSSSVST